MTVVTVTAEFVGAGIVVVVVVVVVVSRETVVAASSCLVAAGIVFGISSSIFGEAPSHFTPKCKTRVGHEATTAGEFVSRFSYHSSAAKSDLQ